MNKARQLTNDARAVLLEAVLAGEQVARAFAFMRNGLRKAQFERGLERLRLMNLAETGTEFLTDEGARLAAALQENEARLVAGIPFSERHAAISLRGGKDTADVEDEWHETTIKGEPFFTNGKVLMLGRAPSKNKMERPPTEEGIHKAWYIQLAGCPVPVVPVAYSEVAGFKTRTRLVFFSDGSALQCEIYNFIKSRYPDAVWTHSPERIYSRFEYGLNAYSKGKRIAATGANSTEPSETIKEIIEAAKEKPVVKVDDLPPASETTDQAVSLITFESRNAVQLSFLDGLRTAA